MAATARLGSICTVLFVDDDPWILPRLEASLAGGPYRVLSTSRPADALELMRAHAVDVLVTDFEMPGLDGVELAARARERFPQAVRLLLTGAGTVRVAADAIERGEIFRLLLKPIEPAGLRRAIEEAHVRLAALRRALAAERRRLRAERLRAALDEAYPGWRAVPRHGGVYVIATDHAAGLVRRLGEGPLGELVRAPLADRPREGLATRGGGSAPTGGRSGLG